MIKIITVGKLKEEYLKKACDDYAKRIAKYHDVEIIEVPHKDSEKGLILERDLILKHISPKDNVLLMAISGKQTDSKEFSKLVEKSFIKKPNITFIIGGSNGVHDDIRKISSSQISFSKMTFPHQVFRLILLEQIYRAFKISKNESYHK